MTTKCLSFKYQPLFPQIPLNFKPCVIDRMRVT